MQGTKDKDGRILRRVRAMRRVQEQALCLFEEHPFEEVTIEQIAALSSTSPATIYRNFGTKEGIVLWDEYDPMLFELLEEELNTHGIRKAMERSLTRALDRVYSEDAKLILRRTRLILGVPELASQSAANQAAMQQQLAALFAKHGKNDLQASVIAGVMMAVLVAAIRAWVEANGEVPLASLLAQAFTSVGELGTEEPTRAVSE
jgi:AcrR family transcriptional regulator